MSHLTKDNLILAMLTCKKRADRHPDAQDAAPPVRLAVPIAVIAVGATAYGLIRIDSQAFASHAGTEAGEERESEGDPFERYDD